MEEHDHVGILLDGAGVAQVGQHGALVGALHVGAGQLGAGQQRHLQLQGDGLEAAGNLADLQLAVLVAAVRRHQLQIVDHNQVQLLVQHEPAAAGTDLGRGDARRIVDIQVFPGQLGQHQAQVFPVPVLEGAGTDGLHVHPGLSAEDTQHDLLLGHFQGEDGHGVALLGGVGGDVDGEAGFAHGRTGPHQDEFAPVQAGQAGVQVPKARGHAGDLPLEPGQVSDLLEGPGQDLLAVLQLRPRPLAHGDVEDHLLTLLQDAVQRHLLLVAHAGNLRRGADQTAQDGLLLEDGDIVGGVGGGGHVLHHPHQVVRPADAVQLAHPAQFLVHRNQVDGAPPVADGADRLINRLILRREKILRRQNLQRRTHHKRILQQSAQYGPLRLQALRRNRTEIPNDLFTHGITG